MKQVEKTVMSKRNKDSFASKVPTLNEEENLFETFGMVDVSYPSSARFTPAKYDIAIAIFFSKLGTPR